MPERRIKCIANGLKNVAAVFFDCLAQQLVMATQRLRHRFAPLFPARGAALDIGEEQRHGPARKRGFQRHAQTFKGKGGRACRAGSYVALVKKSGLERLIAEGAEMNLVIGLMLTFVALSPLPEIAGRIVDNTGKAVSGVTISVVAIPSNQVVGKTVSEKDGSFQLSDLAAGDYGVEAKTDSACAISNAIRVNAGFTSVVQLRLIDGLCKGSIEFVKPPANE